MFCLKITRPYPSWWLNIILECRRHGQYSLYNSQKFAEIMTTHNIEARGGGGSHRIASSARDELYFKSKKDATWFILKWS